MTKKSAVITDREAGKELKHRDKQNEWLHSHTKKNCLILEFYKSNKTQLHFVSMIFVSLR